MNTNANIVVITPRSSADRHGVRTPLARLILPLSVIQGEMFFPCGSVWWIERDNTRVWLRGWGQVSSARVEETLGGNLWQLAWDLSPQTAERLTQPGTLANRSADVSALLADVLTNRRGIQVIPIPPELDLALHARREHLGETTGSFDWARRHIMRLMEQSHLLSHFAQLNGNLSASWQFARAQFARSELVSLSNWDVFQVAAAVLAGLPQMPDAWDTIISQASDDMAMLFHELDVDNIARVEYAWVRNSANSSTSNALEQSDKRHQLILKSLASNLKHQGLVPTYNRFVDLRVVVSTSEFFFEVKTAQPENFTHQVRLAAGQLLEYRFRHQKQNGNQSLGLIAVIERNASQGAVEFARQFLASLDITLVLWDSFTDEFDSLYSRFFSK